MRLGLTTSVTADALQRCELRCAEQASPGATAAPESLQQAPLSARLTALESEVELGLRDARSLVAIPANLARAATVTFPEGAFGRPEPW